MEGGSDHPEQPHFGDQNYNMDVDIRGSAVFSIITMHTVLFFWDGTMLYETYTLVYGNDDGDFNYQEEDMTMLNEENQGDFGVPFPFESYSYEQLLALEELMGRVDKRIPEETIMKNLRIRTPDASATSVDEERDICVICQADYKEEDEAIGALHCGHEYHVECIKKWLQENNACPMCKATAVLEV